tara:strand:+ start:437 stop:754 length:318 start_codon:yes stop_codon:yes gene_type:complete
MYLSNGAAMLVRLTEICKNNTLTSKQEDYTLREVFVNPEHVVMIREEARLHQMNEQVPLTEGLKQGHRFTKLTINRGHTGTEIVVVGSPDIVERHLNTNKQLLRG